MRRPSWQPAPAPDPSEYRPLRVRWWAVVILAQAGVIAVLAVALVRDEPADDFAAPYPVFAPFEQAGTGDGTIDLPAGVTDGILTLTLTHDGPEQFVVTTHNADGGSGKSLVNAPGAYTGTVALGMQPAEAAPARVEIWADGHWTAALAPIAHAPALPRAGTGDGVLRSPGDQAATWTITHDADCYIALHYYPDPQPGDDPGTAPEAVVLVEAGIGYDNRHTVTAPAGPGLVTVATTCSWTIST